jgi:hypothetical protein
MENEAKDPEAPGEEQRIGPLGKKAIDEAEAAMGLAGGRGLISGPVRACRTRTPRPRVATTSASSPTRTSPGTAG